MESMIKRDCERKDASRPYPASAASSTSSTPCIFAGPVAYGLWLWFGP